MSLLDKLRRLTVVVADTGNIDDIKKFSPEDATTNPSIVLKAVASGQYDELLDEVVRWSTDLPVSAAEISSRAAEQLAVRVGVEILRYIPGKISTEVSSAYSFDTEKTVEAARRILALYEAQGVSQGRVLIKIAATWEGIKAARRLQQDGINCNLTLIFNSVQARACAEAGVYLISPFVGRILDWYSENQPELSFTPDREPGVRSVAAISQYFRKHGHKTIVMGASFRNTGEITGLAGCDRMTISPSLLQKLSEEEGELVSRVEYTGGVLPPEEPLDEAEFRWAMNEDPVATEKLASGIRQFWEDQQLLEQILSEKRALLQTDSGSR